MYIFNTKSLAIIFVVSNFKSNQKKKNPDNVHILLKATYAIPKSKTELPRSITAAVKDNHCTLCIVHPNDKTRGN